jgi:hypothetical protein
MNPTPVEPVKVEVRVKTPDELAKLMAFCNEHSIFYIPVTSAAFLPKTAENAPRKPSAAYAELCGPSWLNPKGEATPRNVHNFLTKFVETHKLRRPDGRISLPKILQDVFHMQRAFATEADLLVMAKEVFIDHAAAAAAS